MTTSRRGVLAAAGLVLAMPALGPAFGQIAGERLRGRIVALDGDTLRIAPRDGGEVAVRLSAETTYGALRRVTVAELAPGTRLGVVAEPFGDGLRAVAVTVLPASATREFQSGWDLTPTSSMNNGAVAAVVQRADTHELSLSINGRDIPVRIDATTAIVQPVPAARADLVAGRAVLVNGTRGDGGFAAQRVTVERDGVAPPT